MSWSLKLYVFSTWLSRHTVLWWLYIRNQKRIPNFWIYDAFLLGKQLSIWRIVQNRCPFLKMASVKTNKIKNQTALWKTSFLRYTSLLLGPLSTPKDLKLPFVSAKHGSAYVSNVEYARFNINSEPCSTETKGNFRTFGVDESFWTKQQSCIS